MGVVCAYGLQTSNLAMLALWAFVVAKNAPDADHMPEMQKPVLEQTETWGEEG